MPFAILPARCTPHAISDKPATVSELVFVHGLNSSFESAFGSMAASFESDEYFRHWTLTGFNYNPAVALRTNAETLRTLLYEKREQNNDGQSLFIVAHSMGGLISRLACLSKDAEPCLARRLIMLGTPNFGALRAKQLSLLSQFVVNPMITSLGQFLRLDGIVDLTRTYEIFQDAFLDGYGRTETEYVTIPGTFFNESRPDAYWPLATTHRWKEVFKAVNLASRYTEALMPIVRMTLEKPHDGIVEEASCSLSPSGPGRFSEKMHSLESRSAAAKTYYHCCYTYR